MVFYTVPFKYWLDHTKGYLSFFIWTNSQYTGYTSSGFRFVLSHGTDSCPRLWRVSIAPSIQTTWQEIILASVWWTVTWFTEVYHVYTFLKSQEKHHHLSVAYLFSLLAKQIWCIMSTIYPGCITWDITALSGATQISYPDYWGLCSLNGILDVSSNKRPIKTDSNNVIWNLWSLSNVNGYCLPIYTYIK